MSNPHFFLSRPKTQRLTGLDPRAPQIQNDGIRDRCVEVKFSCFYKLESCDLFGREGKVSALG